MADVVEGVAPKENDEGAAAGVVVDVPPNKLVEGWVDGAAPNPKLVEGDVVVGCCVVPNRDVVEDDGAVVDVGCEPNKPPLVDPNAVVVDGAAVVAEPNEKGELAAGLFC